LQRIMTDDVDVFFQAEDGIRDRNVTGIQTCALPISHHRRRPGFHRALVAHGRHSGFYRAGRLPPLGFHAVALAPPLPGKSEDVRSEERRVGKECSNWW